MRITPIEKMSKNELITLVKIYELRAKLTSDYFEQSRELEKQPESANGTLAQERYAILSDAYINQNTVLAELLNCMGDTSAQKFIDGWHKKKCENFLDM